MLPTAAPAALPGDDHVGVIYGNVGTTEFRFAVNDPNLKRLDYVKVRHETDGTVLAQVTEITRESSLSYDQAAQISGGYAAEASDRLTAHAKVIGYRDGRGLMQTPRTPFKAGEMIYRADYALIAAVFGLRDQDGAFIGFVKGYEMPVHLDINTLVQKHVSVLAKTGSGKSYVVGCLMEELIKRGIPIVVVDPHGEHASLARPNTNEDDYPIMRRFGVRPRAYGEHLIEYSPDTRVNENAVPLRLDGVGLTAIEIADGLGVRLSASQQGLLQSAVREIAEEKKDYTLGDVLQRVKASPSNTKWNLVQAIENLIGLEIFADTGTPVSSLVKRDKVSILNLKGVAPDVQQVVVSTICRKLFDARKTGQVPPFMLVVEEAHNFCPERGLHASLSSDELRTIASEGRKFGMGLTVVSQRPAKVDKNVLSQCNTQIILKVTNPNDLKAITSSVEGLTADTEDEIQRLPVGVAIVSHPRIAMPVLVEIRPRETSHGGQSVDVMKSVQAEETFLTVRKPAKPTRASEAEEDEEEDEDEDAGTSAGPEKDPAEEEAEAVARFERVPARPPLAGARQATLVPQPPPASVAAPRAAAPPGVAPAPARPVAPARAPPPVAGAPRRALPAWVEAAREEFEAVEEADLARWDEEAVVRLAKDLAARAAQLRTLAPDQQDALGDFTLRFERRRAEVEELADQIERRRNSPLRRLFARKATPPAEEGRKPPKRTPLGAERRKPRAKRKGGGKRG